eukprot:gene2842-17744_t
MAGLDVCAFGTLMYTISLMACSLSNDMAALNVCNMFTGIVQGLAEIAAVNNKDLFSQINITFPAGKTDGITMGASVAINGTCLTVTAADGDTLSFDIMMETLRATSLGGLEPGIKVNFERAARVGDEIGGHNVSGHVHSKAKVSQIDRLENNTKLTFELEDAMWMKYILAKGYTAVDGCGLTIGEVVGNTFTVYLVPETLRGYIAVDGCSLTIGEVVGNTFTVYLIPETLRVTVFGTKEVGDYVNIEIETQTQAVPARVPRSQGPPGPGKPLAKPACNFAPSRACNFAPRRYQESSATRS